MNSLVGTPVTYNLPNRPDSAGTITRANPAICWVTFPDARRGETFRFEKADDGQWRLPSKQGKGPALRFTEK